MDFGFLLCILSLLLFCAAAAIEIQSYKNRDTIEMTPELFREHVTQQLYTLHSEQIQEEKNSHERFQATQVNPPGFITPKDYFEGTFRFLPQWTPNEFCSLYLQDNPFYHVSSRLYEQSKIANQYALLIKERKSRLKRLNNECQFNNESLSCLIRYRDQQRNDTVQCKLLYKPIYIHIIMNFLLESEFINAQGPGVVTSYLQESSSYEELQQKWVPFATFTNKELQTWILHEGLNASSLTEAFEYIDTHSDDTFNEIFGQSITILKKSPARMLLHMAELRLVKHTISYHCREGWSLETCHCNMMYYCSYCHDCPVCEPLTRISSRMGSFQNIIAFTAIYELQFKLYSL